MKSPWAVVAAVWIVLVVVGVVAGAYLYAWYALACSGLSLLALLVDRLQKHQLRILLSHNRILAARIRLHEKDRQ
jgi:hypothetical protein